jgi:pimeloyl-ACP methyl ester carboxylesterase
MSDQSAAPPKHFVVFIPGYMGSLLRDRATGKTLWIDLPGMLRNPLRIGRAIDELFDRLRYPNPDIEPAGILNQVIFVPPLFKQEHYGRMLVALEKWGYAIDPVNPDPDSLAAYTFAYDWRQDNRISAQQLGEAIDGWRVQHPGAEAWLIGHSNGGIVARWYIEQEGGKEHVGRLFLMGSPWDGAPKAIQVMHSGLEVMFMRVFNLLGIPERTRDLVRSFPSFYQLIPHSNPYLRDPNNLPIDLFGDLSWLETDEQRQMMMDGLAFNRALGMTLSVETFCFFGYRKPTSVGGVLKRDASGGWLGIEWDRSEAGDGTVPERSAVHPQAKEKLPFRVGHGDIYISTDVLEKLEWELQRKYRAGVLAEITTERLHIQFEPERDVYAPGEAIPLWATVDLTATNEPVVDAHITVQMTLREALLLGEEAQPEFTPLSVTLLPDPDDPGRYTGSLEAPDLAGYYKLEALVDVEQEETVLLEELVLVEGEPDEWMIDRFFPLESSAPPPESEPETSDEGSVGEGQPWDEPPPTIGSPGDREQLDDISFSPPFPAPPPPSPAPPDRGEETPAESRFFTADLPGHDMQQPLIKDKPYPLTISVELAKRPPVMGVAFNDDEVFSEGEEWVELHVSLVSKDFKLLNEGAQALMVPRKGASWNKVTFIIQPLHSGVGELTVNFLKGNNYVKGMYIEFNVDSGEKALAKEVEVVGRSLEQAGALGSRDLHLFIRKHSRDNLYIMAMTHAGRMMEADLEIDPLYLNSLILKARKELLDVVYMCRQNGKIDVYTPRRGQEPPDTLYYQYKIAPIPEDIHQEALLRLAKRGWFLFNEIFYGMKSGADAAALGDILLQLATTQTDLKIQVTSQDFLLPWGMLYMAEEAPFTYDEVDPARFLGFSHIVEQIPLNQHPEGGGEVVPVEPQLLVNLVLNEGIDKEFGIEAAKAMRNYWEALEQQGGGKITLDTKFSKDEFLSTLRKPEAVGQILYLLCHGDTEGVDVRGNPLDSALTLSGNTRVSLEELQMAAPVKKTFKNAPLVFINACESAELTPLFYAGFMPYFMSKGARGVIGTECKAPARFAAHWAQRFFEEFVKGEACVGEIFLKLRKEYLKEYNNVLGLMYALYCDGDIRLASRLGA